MKPQICIQIAHNISNRIENSFYLQPSIHEFKLINKNAKIEHRLNNPLTHFCTAWLNYQLKAKLMLGMGENPSPQIADVPMHNK